MHAARLLTRTWATGLALILTVCSSAAWAKPGSGAPKFQQLGELLATPGDTRLASGAPGPGYWQQRADYNIDVRLDDAKQRLTGKVSIDYHNRSPHTLTYLWVQLDQNRFRPDSDDMLTQTAPKLKDMPFSSMTRLIERQQFEGGYNIGKVVDGAGRDLPHTINKTMMRIDLPQALQPGQSFRFTIDWDHNIIDALNIGGRGGYEYFEKDKNYIYEIAQWYPRIAAYTDYEGWQNKQFLGRGEFTLELGDFTVNITAPSDHIVTATGVLQNPEAVLSKDQRKRLAKAETAKKPVFIVTPKEAAKNERKKTKGEKTWTFKAENVRDFAWASSRKFIWDAQGVKSGDQTVLAMSLYPNEAEPLWSQYSTHAIIHTIEHYNRYTFDYPYPVSISVNGPVGGMEYPMITFNKPRPYEDGTYWDVRQEPKSDTWKRSKYGLISVIIHEVGHNYFPMIVNSDERQWTWMDEGMNTFLQFIAEQAWEEDYPSRRGEPKNMVQYMSSTNQVPIMTNSESILQFGNNAYGKPATALNVLRESIMGRELFDFAFREFAQRWKFKRPTPEDFFRTMEDASAVDLDWFWRGWFYSTDNVDVAVSKVTRFELDSRDPDVEKKKARKKDADEPQTLSEQRNKGQTLRIEEYPELEDFYTEFDEFAVTPKDYADYKKLLKELDSRDKLLLKMDRHFLKVEFENIGGLVTPLPLVLHFADGSKESITIPAEIWRRNGEKVAKLFVREKEITGIDFDPYLETADIDTSNNSWPRKPETTRFKLYKHKLKKNPMQKAKK